MDANKDPAQPQKQQRIRRQQHHLRRRRRNVQSTTNSANLSNPSETTAASETTLDQTTLSLANLDSECNIDAKSTTQINNNNNNNSNNNNDSDLRQSEVTLEKNSPGVNKVTFSDANEQAKLETVSPTHPERLQVSSTTSTTTTTTNIAINTSINAVRVLFRDQQLQRQSNLAQQVGQPQFAGDLTAAQAAIVSANRRLIERQIETIQEADSRRWNFDFVNCRPLLLAEHRYADYANQMMPIRNCRPLNDQNQTNSSDRLDSQQQRQPHSWIATPPKADRRNRGDNKKDDV